MRMSRSALRRSELSSLAASGSAWPVSRAIGASMSTCQTSSSDVLPGDLTRAGQRTMNGTLFHVARAK